MHKGTMGKSGRECDIYDGYEEVEAIAFRPPRYCDKDATELVYYSFFDSMNRFTLKAGCKTCKRSWAVSVKEEKYEEREQGFI